MTRRQRAIIFKEIRKDREIKEICELARVNRNIYYRIMNEEDVKISTLEKFEKALKIKLI